MLLKKLTELNGVSGNEEEVREFIQTEISKYCDETKVDALGNLIAYKKGRTSRRRVMLSAHMDEVGLMVTGYSDGGFLKFKTIGGIDERILPGKRVLVGDKKLPGIIGVKAVHLMDVDERRANIKLKGMYIDIGAEKREEAEKLAMQGDYIAFHSEYREAGSDCIKAKALDDRAGCAVLMEALKERYDFDLIACFTVQEEVGLRGSETAAYTVAPDIALVIETTTCSDVPGVEKQDYTTVLGQGAALTVMDRTAYADKHLVEYLYSLAKANDIAVQFKQTTAGGNDAGSIQKSRAGVKVASISIPCRYIHSPVSMMSRKDFHSCNKLTCLTLKEWDKNPEQLEKILAGGSLNV